MERRSGEDLVEPLSGPYHAGALAEVKGLPGNYRQRVKGAITELAGDPRPSTSKALKTQASDYELRRIRFDKWRIVYAVTDADKAVDVLAVRKRPPYDYGDLESLLADV